MAGMQETDRLTLKNGITYLLQDAKARAQLADLLTEVMEKYGADNPPPYPVTSVNGQTGDVIVGGAVDSVNGQTGAVVLDANDVGALPNTTQIPSKTSDLANDSGFVNAAGAAAAAPVQSVNGQTGAATVHGVPAGGTTGQVLKKASNADYDADWENESGGSGSGIAIQDDEPTDGELVWIDTDDPGTTHIIPEIDDTQESAVDTWSSQKIASEIAGANDSDDGYCKMPDGTLMCWGSFSTGTLTANVAWGSLYETPAVSVSVAFPVRFAVAPCVWYKCRTTSSQCMLEDATIVSTTGIGGSIYLYRPTSASVSAFVQWLVIGRWK